MFHHLILFKFAIFYVYNHFAGTHIADRRAKPSLWRKPAERCPTGITLCFLNEMCMSVCLSCVFNTKIRYQKKNRIKRSDTLRQMLGSVVRVSASHTLGSWFKILEKPDSLNIFKNCYSSISGLWIGIRGLLLFVTWFGNNLVMSNALPITVFEKVVSCWGCPLVRLGGKCNPSILPC